MPPPPKKQLQNRFSKLVPDDYLNHKVGFNYRDTQTVQVFSEVIGTVLVCNNSPKRVKSGHFYDCVPMLRDVEVVTQLTP